jgi:CubicO group peptidase (beta-lactamase class C family)
MVTLNGLRVGYGYQTWILSSDRGQFMMVGLGFQRVATDPQTQVVITVFSNPEVTIPARVTQSYEAEFQQLFNAVVSQAEKGEL